MSEHAHCDTATQWNTTQQKRKALIHAIHGQALKTFVNMKDAKINHTLSDSMFMKCPEKMHLKDKVDWWLPEAGDRNGDGVQIGLKYLFEEMEMF